MFSGLHSSHTIKALTAAAGLALSPSPPAPENKSLSPTRSAIGSEVVLQGREGDFDSWNARIEKHRFNGLLFLSGVPFEEAHQTQGSCLFPLASLSKQFTAAAVLTLANKGKLSLEQALGDIFPEAPQDKRGITIRQLLTHTSGLNPEIPLGIDPSNRDAMIAGILKNPVTGAPGSRWNYANSGYVLLAGIVERVSGEPFVSFVDREVLRPLGMNSTFFYGDPRIAELAENQRELLLHATTKPSASSGYLNRTLGWGMMGAGGMVSSPQDLCRWHEALRAMPLEAFDYCRELRTPAMHGYTAGGLFFSLLPNGRPVVGHDGLDRWGNKSFFAATLDAPGTVILYSAEGSIPDELRRAATLGLIGEVPWTTAPLTELQSHCGTYKTIDGDQLEISTMHDPYNQGLYLITKPTGALLSLVTVQAGEISARVCNSLTEQTKALAQDLSSDDPFLFAHHKEEFRTFLEKGRASPHGSIHIVGTNITTDGFAYETRIEIPSQDEGAAPLDYVLLWAVNSRTSTYQIQAAGLASSIYKKDPLRQMSIASLPCYPSESGDAYYFDQSTYAPSIRLHFTTDAQGNQAVEIYTGQGMMSATRMQ